MRSILVAALVLALAGPAAAFDIAFQLESPGASQVYLAGSFNGWSTSANAMSDDGDGLFTLTLNLDPGVYEYKFVVDGNWIADESAAAFKDDGFGGKNSIVEVLADGSVKGLRAPAAKKPAQAALAERVLFRCESPGAGQVFLAGNFNGWSTSSNALGDEDGDGVFTLAMKLDPGVYEYKFVIDGVWTEDPNAAEFKDDGFGGKNSVIEVLADGSVKGGQAALAPAAKKDAPDAGGEGVTFRLEPKTGGVGEVFLAGSFNDWSATADRMTDEDGDGVYEISKKLAPGEYSYKFVVDGNWLADENARAGR